MNINDVIIKPVITEKSSNLLSNNVYTFEVNSFATKTDVKKAIEIIFSKTNAKVKKVNLMVIKRKKAKLGKYEGYKKGYKKAIVSLKEGSIPVYGSEGVEDQSKKSKTKTPLKIIDTEKILNEASNK